MLSASQATLAAHAPRVRAHARSQRARASHRRRRRHYGPRIALRTACGGCRRGVLGAPSPPGFVAPCRVRLLVVMMVAA